MAYRRSLPASTDAASFLALGRFALELRDAELGRRFSGEAVARDPLSAEAREQLGLCLGLLGRAQEATEQLSEAVRLDPGSASAHLNLATSHAQSGRFEAAREAARQALALRPEYPRARQLLEELEREP